MILIIGKTLFHLNYYLLMNFQLTVKYIVMCQNFLYCKVNCSSILYYRILYQEKSVVSVQTYSMDCYFRQSWVDRRLAFQGGKETLALSISMLARIWKPDTYFYNGKHSYLHTITSPNKFVRLYQDGRVLYSSRYVNLLRSSTIFH